VKEDFDDGREADPFRHEQFNQSKQFLGQHHKAQRPDADQKRGQQFCKDVAIEDFIQMEIPGRSKDSPALHYSELNVRCKFGRPLMVNRIWSSE
jgi:hypothetical protein